MRILSVKALREFWEEETGAEDVLRNFYKKLSGIDPQNFAELRSTFPAVDLVGICFVFNVGGNKYRVVARIHFNRQMVFIRHVLTHKEYDKDKWKADC